MRPADRIVLILLALTSLAAIGFIAVYVVGNDTQLLGLSLGLAFVFLAGAAVVAGKKIVDQRDAVEERQPLGRVAEAEKAIHVLDRARADTTGEPPPLKEATPTQIAEAIRIGPYVMPGFSTKALTPAQVNSIVRYVQYAQHPENKGGWGIGNIGPIPEGMVAWFLGGVALLLCARLIGTRNDD